MNSLNKLVFVLLLSVLAVALAGCSTMPPPQPSPPVLSQKLKLGQLPANVAAIDPAPSTDFLLKQETYLLDLQTFQKKLNQWSSDVMLKSKP